MRALFRIAGLSIAAVPFAAAGWTDLIHGKGLDGWEKIGQGIWTVMRDGTLVGQRDLATAEHQAWLYTRKNYGQYDLRLEYWLRAGGNSGISIRDTSRAQYAHGAQWNPEKTPSHIGYEIQLSNGYKDVYPSGSVYLFAKAKPGVQTDNEWNQLDVESRDDAIRVKVNGQLVSEFAGEPGRPKAGPIGLQLHDKNTLVMFRNVRIREIR